MLVGAFGEGLTSPVQVVVRSDQDIDDPQVPAVIVDAALIRVILVPATMRLMGEWNWRLPKWLDRILPTVELEKEVEAPARDGRHAVGGLTR
ncbi:MAG: hypothetical protein GXP34_08720 [Actinobacteria bacterium]|nr:hypothetical protein [Actinomycetota bacterium]